MKLEIKDREKLNGIPMVTNIVRKRPFKEAIIQRLGKRLATENNIKILDFSTGFVHSKNVYVLLFIFEIL